MSDYADKLALIAERKQKLHDEEIKLIEKRKKEIADLAEKHHALMANDTVLVGLFTELNDALKNKTDRLKEWETAGARFLKSKK